MPRLGGLDGCDLVFGTNPTPETARGAEMSHLARTLARAGLDQKYETNGRSMISTHSFRAFFITKVSRHDPNLAKYFAGQKGYLLQYDRLSDEEKLEHYIKFEPSLLVCDPDRRHGRHTRVEWNYKGDRPGESMYENRAKNGYDGGETCRPVETGYGMAQRPCRHGQPLTFLFTGIRCRA